MIAPLPSSSTKSDDDSNENPGRWKLSQYSFWIVAIAVLVLFEIIDDFKTVCPLQQPSPATMAATTIIKENKTKPSSIHTVGWVRPNVTYGLIHIAKTAGTTINGALALNFERVCGNKGYSYDYAAVNKEFKAYVERTGDRSSHFKSSYTLKLYESKGIRNNGDKEPDTMEYAIGYEDCDYIATEKYPWNNHLLKSWKIELHVPCRPPIDHLMSMFNLRRGYREYLFNCSNPDVNSELKKHVPDGWIERRFRRGQLAQNENFTLKCFDQTKVKPYLDYMGKILQPKRFTFKYEHRATNLPRNKSEECLWNDLDLQEKYKQAMLQKYDYYRFCDSCIGTENDLLVGVE